MSARQGAGIGVAIFVKTPGHSPVKTRLAEAIGTEAATEFHRLSADAVAAVAKAAQAETPDLVPHWAVAEAEALEDPSWKDLPRLGQGDGNLGARMRGVCEQLLASHDAAILIGADAPQITVADLREAVAGLESHDHVLGPAADGGFWLLGARRRLPDGAWEATPWSHSRTAERFLSHLNRPLARLRTLRDADTVDDLAPLLTALGELAEPLPEQITLMDWLRKQSGSERRATRLPLRGASS